MPTAPDVSHRAPPRPVPLAAALLGVLLLAGCGTTSKPPPVTDPQDRAPRNPPLDLAAIPDAVPRYEPPSRYGNPATYKVNGRTYRTGTACANFTQQGIASWYGTKFHGRRTSSGEPYDMYAMTAAHKTLPLPSYVRVTRRDTGQSIVVRVNDRGPFHEGRIIDLSYAAATKLGVAQRGTAPVTVECLPMNPDDATVAANAVEEPQYLQLGAFRERARADALKQRLAQQTDLPPVQIRSDFADGVMRHRVLLGPVTTAAEAERLTQRLQADGFERPYRVAENLD